MTCIVGVEHGGRVFIGADSLSSCGGMVTQLHEPKVFRCGSLLVGVAGSMAWALTVRHHLSVRLPRGDLAGYMIATLRGKLEELWDDHHGDSDYESELLLGARGQLYAVDTTFTPYRAAEGYASIGSGGDVARGALAVLRGDPTQRLTAALEAAERHVPTVRRPWLIESI